MNNDGDDQKDWERGLKDVIENNLKKKCFLESYYGKVIACISNVLFILKFRFQEVLFWLVRSNR